MESASRGSEDAQADPYRASSQSIDSSAYLSESEASSTFASPQDALDYMCQVQTAQSQRGPGLELHPTALSRIATQRSQHSATVGAGLKPRVSRKLLPAFGAGKPYPPPLPAKEEYVVEFTGLDDPLHPQNWSTGKKVATAVILAYTTFNITFTSSIYSPATSAVSPEFHVSNEIGRAHV